MKEGTDDEIVVVEYLRGLHPACASWTVRRDFCSSSCQRATSGPASSVAEKDVVECSVEAVLEVSGGAADAALATGQEGVR